MTRCASLLIWIIRHSTRDELKVCSYLSLESVALSFSDEFWTAIFLDPTFQFRFLASTSKKMLEHSDNKSDSLNYGSAQSVAL